MDYPFQIACVQLPAPLRKNRRRFCLVPRPHYSARAKAFWVTWSDRKCETSDTVRPRIRHRNELTERDWENAVQGLGQGEGMYVGEGATEHRLVSDG